MPVFKELDPEVAQKLIEGFEDELSGETLKLEAFYRQFKCPAGCSGQMLKEFAPNHAFADPDTLVPRALLRCGQCKLLLDPHSRLVVAAGSKVALQ